jgi:hypothetical protein
LSLSVCVRVCVGCSWRESCQPLEESRDDRPAGTQACRSANKWPQILRSVIFIGAFISLALRLEFDSAHCAQPDWRWLVMAAAKFVSAGRWAQQSAGRPAGLQEARAILAPLGLAGSSRARSRGAHLIFIDINKWRAGRRANGLANWRAKNNEGAKQATSPSGSHLQRRAC